MSAAVAKNILLVVAHPEAKSFVCALANTAAETLTAAGHTVVGKQCALSVSCRVATSRAAAEWRPCAHCPLAMPVCDDYFPRTPRMHR